MHIGNTIHTQVFINNLELTLGLPAGLQFHTSVVLKGKVKGRETHLFMHTWGDLKARQSPYRSQSEQTESQQDSSRAELLDNLASMCNQFQVLQVHLQKNC